MNQKTQGISKDQRLKSTKAIAGLFENGSTVKAYPLRLVYRMLPLENPQGSHIKIGFVASKRKFKHAVDRNKVKRLMRETFRTNKSPLDEITKNYNQRIEGLLIFTGNEIPNLYQLQKSWTKLFQRFPKKQ